MWRKPSGQSADASNVEKGDECDSDELEVGDDHKQNKKKVSLRIPEREQTDELSKIVGACHVTRKEEAKVIKTWRSWLKDPNLYKVLSTMSYISVFFGLLLMIE